MAVNAAGYQLGVEGWALPQKIVAEVYKTYMYCSTLGKLARTDYEKITGGSLKCFDEVRFPTLTGFCDSNELDTSQFNGQVEELGDPFSDGVVKVCQTYKFEKKFDRSQWERFCDRQVAVKSGVEDAVADLLKKRIDVYGMQKIVASADISNVGKSAGRISHNIDLGDTNAPIVVTDGAGAEEVLRRLEQTLIEAEVACETDGLVLLTSPYFWGRLRQGQTLINCCDTNPKLTGMMHKAYGFEVIQTPNIPFVNAAGKRVEYIALVDPSTIGAPSDILYMDWQKLKHEVYMVGSALYDTIAMNSRSIAVAAITSA